MLPNLSESLRKILLSFERKASSEGLYSSNALFLALCQNDATCSSISSALSLKKISEKSINLSELVAKSYTEAYKDGAGSVYPYHALLALLLVSTPSYYKDAYLTQQSLQLLQKDPKTTISNDDFSPFTNLTYLAANKKLPKIISRDKELDYIISSYLQRDRKPLLLLGPDGIGKTSLAYGLAQKINDWKVPRPFLGAQVLMLDSIRDSFEKGLLSVLDTYSKYGVKTILFFDDIHLASVSGIIGVSALPLSRGLGLKEDLPISFLGASADSLSIRPWGPSLSDFWEEYLIPELSVATTCQILNEKIRLEPYYKKISVASSVLSTISKTTEVSPKMPQVNPGKSVFVLNMAIATARIRAEKITPTETATKKRIDQLNKQLGSLIVNSKFDKSIKVAGNIKQEIKKMEALFKRDSVKITILQKDIKDILSSENISGVGAKKSVAYKDLLVSLEGIINEQIIGQHKASNALSLAVRRAETNIAERGTRPAGSFLFLGPTGVGKTETAKVLSRILKDAYKLKTPNFLRLDMADFMERHTVARLTGSPPGYVGYDEGGQLTEFVLNNPKSIILFDEIEKAHPDVLNILLAILEEGELTGGGGEVASFKECIVILTSNIGSELLSHKEIGFGEVEGEGRRLNVEGRKETGRSRIDGNKNKENLPSSFYSHSLSSTFYPLASGGKTEQSYEKLFLDATKKILKPEFLNRLDEIIVFKQLDENDLLKIIDLQLEPIIRSLKQKGIKLLLTDIAKREILAQGNFKEYGARELRRIIEKQILDPINIAIFNGSLGRGTVASFGEGLKLTLSSKPVSVVL